MHFFNIYICNVNPHTAQGVAVCLFGCSIGKILQSVVYVLVFCVQPRLPEMLDVSNVSGSVKAVKKENNNTCFIMMLCIYMYNVI